MGRHQRGHIYESSGAFYSRYYATEIVDGLPRRVKRSTFIAFKDQKYYAVNARAVKLKHDENMLAVNSSSSVNEQEISVADFWNATYLPYAKENLRHSTVSGYVQIWNQHLENHFADRTLREYRTHIGSQFLTALAKTPHKLGRRTLAHIRSLASGIFTHAVNSGFLESNPWHDVKILAKVNAPENTPHYTLEEAENIISALVDRVDCQLIVALSFFLGLRPSEIVALQWNDFDARQVHIRRAYVRGRLGECKTPESVASLPLVDPVLVPFALWRKKCADLIGNPKGWLFPNQKGSPVNLTDLVHGTIRPILQSQDIAWKGLYAGRRGAGTLQVDLTGGLVSAQELLRHKSLTTTAMFYKKRTQNALANGMKLLEEAAGKP